MDTIITALRGLNLGRKSKSNDKGKGKCKRTDSPSRDRSKRRDEDANAPNEHRDTNKEVDDLLRIIATSLIGYALRKYLSSSHNKKRIKSGGANIDFAILQAIGEKVLEKVLQVTYNTAANPKTRSIRSGSEERHKRRRRDPEPHHHTRRRRHSSRSTSADRHREKLRHRRYRVDHADSRLEPHASSGPSITVTPPTVSSGSPAPSHAADDHQSASSGRHKDHAKLEATVPPSRTSSRRRVTRADYRRHALNLGPLREDLESLSATLIELSARAAQPEGQAGHVDCNFYRKFVGKSGPVQDAIGEVLGKIREIEEGD